MLLLQQVAPPIKMAASVKVVGKSSTSSQPSSNLTLNLVIIPAIIIGALAVGIVVFEGLNSTSITFEKIPLEPVVIVNEDRERLWSVHTTSQSFIIKPKLHKSHLFGFIWNEKLLNMNWLAFDGASFGQLEILTNKMQIMLSFIIDVEPGLGDTWTVRWDIHPLCNESSILFPLTIYVYINDGGQLNLNMDTISGSVNEIYGYTLDIKDFRLYFPYKRQDKDTVYKYTIGYLSSVNELNQVLHDNLSKIPANEKWPLFLSNNDRNKQKFNFVSLQEIYNVSGLVETDIVFESGIYSAAMSISGDHFTTVLGGKFREFDRKFEEAFHLKHKGFELSVINMAQRSLSNLLGSLSYTYNTIKVESSDPIESFSASFFGINSNGTSSFSTNCYCLLVLIHWDINLAKEILGRWFDLTNYNGWIPEVWSFDTDNILKHEIIHGASSPPVALLTIDQLIDKMITTNTMDLAYLNRLFPRVEAWIEWLYHIHKGSIEGAFRWQTNGHIPHGHKDVPGGTHFTEDDRHLDLRCWMAQGFRVLLRMANLTQRSSDRYQSIYKSLFDMKELDDLHWDEKRKIYSDYGLTLDQPSDNVKLRFITHIGYSSIFPVLFKVIPPNSPKLGYLLKHISDRNGLWSSHGLRSLSKRDKKNIHHFKDDNIWSGPVHLSINYLALRSLRYYSAANGPYSLIATNLYTKLRNMVISTILKSYADTNQLWLYYDSESGQGMGTPNNHLASLVISILAEKY